MTDVKQTIHLIAYKDSANIGDNFQTLITKHVLEGLGYDISYIDRDEKDTDKKKVVFINWYYSPKTIQNLNIEFSDQTKAVFYNIHLASDKWRVKYLKQHFLTNPSVYQSFKKHEPIGCRDQATANLLQSFNIVAENNQCITLLWQKRTQEQAQWANKIILVDVDEFVPLPKSLKTDFDVEYRSQMIPNGADLSNDEKLRLSEEILHYYKHNAKLIVTSRFHCAMPCIAMGIPVVFLGDANSKRCAWLKKYIPVYDYIHLGFRTVTHLKKLSWSDYIPLLNRHIKHEFNVIDIVYNILYKLYLHAIYFLKIKTIEWNVEMPNIEQYKHDTIHKIRQRLSQIDTSYFA